MKRIFTLILTAMMLCCMAAQAQSHVKWKATYQIGSNGQGTITLTADIDKDWHIYGMKLPENGPVPTSIKFAGEGFKFIGDTKAAPAPKSVNDEMFGPVTYWEGKVKFTQKFKRTDKNAKKVTLSVSYMSCNDANCLPPRTETITLDIK